MHTTRSRRQRALAVLAITIAVGACSPSTDPTELVAAPTTTTLTPDRPARPVIDPQERAWYEHAAQVALYTSLQAQADWYQGAVDAAEAAERARVAQTRREAGSGAHGGGGGTPPNDFLACVRQRESGGNYGISDPSYSWHGAYQFSQQAWNATAQHAGRPDLVGVNPANASPADQDAMAAVLYGWQGTGPWAGGNYAC